MAVGQQTLLSWEAAVVDSWQAWAGGSVLLVPLPARMSSLLRQLLEQPNTVDTSLSS